MEVPGQTIVEPENAELDTEKQAEVVQKQSFSDVLRDYIQQDGVATPFEEELTVCQIVPLRVTFSPFNCYLEVHLLNEWFKTTEDPIVGSRLKVKNLKFVNLDHNEKLIDLEIMGTLGEIEILPPIDGFEEWKNGNNISILEKDEIKKEIELYQNRKQEKIGLVEGEKIVVKNELEVTGSKDASQEKSKVVSEEKNKIVSEEKIKVLSEEKTKAVSQDKSKSKMASEEKDKVASQENSKIVSEEINKTSIEEVAKIQSEEKQKSIEGDKSKTQSQEKSKEISEEKSNKQKPSASPTKTNDVMNEDANLGKRVELEQLSLENNIRISPTAEFQVVNELKEDKHAQFQASIIQNPINVKSPMKIPHEIIELDPISAPILSHPTPTDKQPSPGQSSEKRNSPEVKQVNQQQAPVNLQGDALPFYSSPIRDPGCDSSSSQIKPLQEAAKEAIEKLIGSINDVPEKDRLVFKSASKILEERKDIFENFGNIDEVPELDRLHFMTGKQFQDKIIEIQETFGNIEDIPEQNRLKFVSGSSLLNSIPVESKDVEIIEESVPPPTPATPIEQTKDQESKHDSLEKKSVKDAIEIVEEVLPDSQKKSLPKQTQLVEQEVQMANSFGLFSSNFPAANTPNLPMIGIIEPLSVQESPKPKEDVKDDSTIFSPTLDQLDGLVVNQTAPGNLIGEQEQRVSPGQFNQGEQRSKNLQIPNMIEPEQIIEVPVMPVEENTADGIQKGTIDLLSLIEKPSKRTVARKTVVVEEDDEKTVNVKSPQNTNVVNIIQPLEVIVEKTPEPKKQTVDQATQTEIIMRFDKALQIIEEKKVDQESETSQLLKFQQEFRDELKTLKTSISKMEYFNSTPQAPNNKMDINTRLVLKSLLEKYQKQPEKVLSRSKKEWTREKNLLSTKKDETKNLLKVILAKYKKSAISNKK